MRGINSTWTEKANQCSHRLIYNILFGQYINRHFFYKSSFIKLRRRSGSALACTCGHQIWWRFIVPEKTFLCKSCSFEWLVGSVFAPHTEKKTSLGAFPLFTLVSFNISKDVHVRWKHWNTHWYVCDCEWVYVLTGSMLGESSYPQARPDGGNE